MDFQIPEPFIFNPYKHHAGILKSFIIQYRQTELTKSRLNPVLLKMGNCMIDLYFGDLAISEIVQEVANVLIQWGIFEREAYVNSLNSQPRNYLNIQISDGSTWTLLIGDEVNRYIHIHPARGSARSVRVKAIALKTAVIMKLLHINNLNKMDLVTLTNHIRINFLQESPIKNAAYTKGISRALVHL